MNTSSMQVEKNAIFQMRFPQKLWYLLSMRTDAILWGGTGRTILLNYRVLHNYLQFDHSIFKTTNISSFVRQLNLYGFRKVTSHLQDPLCNSSNPYMHEYIHDYFQFGCPELLNKITRKALTMRRHFKPKGLCTSNDQYMYTTPLQKARRALHIALRKAGQELLIQNSPKQFCKLIESDENPDDFCEDEESIEFDWNMTKNLETEIEKQITTQGEEDNNNNNNDDDDTKINMDNNMDYEKPPQDIMNFNDETQANSDSFPGQFLSMPELDAEPTVAKSGAELLAEFDIEEDVDQGIGSTINKNDHNSLNCVLPSISNDNIDEAQDNSDNLHDYNDGEWDQMFNDMISNKGSTQDCSSDLKDLYSQISRTIDLLNS